MARKSISKKTRFEIFKRDKFTCQYCGRMAPDVVLEIDHIKPVCDGGNNNQLNLLTSCFECNRGKGKVKLDDDSSIKKQQEQLKLLAERREQLDLLIKWKESLSNIDLEVANKVTDTLCKRYSINDNFEDDLFDCINKCIRKFGDRIVIDTCYEYCKEKLTIKDFETACYYKNLDLQNPTSKDINYIVKILYNRNIIYHYEKKNMYMKINLIAKQFYGTEKYKDFISSMCINASECEDIDDFNKNIQIRIIGDKNEEV